MSAKAAVRRVRCNLAIIRELTGENKSKFVRTGRSSFRVLGGVRMAFTRSRGAQSVTLNGVPFAGFSGFTQEGSQISNVEEAALDKWFGASFKERDAPDPPAGHYDISGVDKMVLLKKMWENATPAQFYSGTGVAAPAWDHDVAARAIQGYAWRDPQGYVDYLLGRPIKMDLSGDTVDASAYDSYAGEGAFVRVLQDCR
jgi:hypothetical protein